MSSRQLVLICLFFCSLLCIEESTTSRIKESVTFLGMFPPSFYYKRLFTNSIKNPIREFSKEFESYNLQVDFEEVTVDEEKKNPAELLKFLCGALSRKRIITILYMTNKDVYGRDSAYIQYLIQLAGYIHIPVIVWTADNSGIEEKASESFVLQMNPTIDNQVEAMMEILERYSWFQFTVVTTRIAGYDDFIQAVRDNIEDKQARDKRIALLGIIQLQNTSDYHVRDFLSKLRETESRVILLYSTMDEAKEIFDVANDLGLTQRDYMWIVSHSVVNEMKGLMSFPTGMLGLYLNKTSEALAMEINKGTKVFVNGLSLLLSDSIYSNISVQANISCDAAGSPRWLNGEIFYKFMKNVSIIIDPNKPNLEFNSNGGVKFVELEIVNFVKGTDNRWEKIGKWSSEGLDIKDIVWPGDSPVPPRGFPEKYHLKIVTIEEPPYMIIESPDPISGKCNANRGVLCRVGKPNDTSTYNTTSIRRNSSTYHCCSGFCIDLLDKLANDMGFEYDLYKVEDGKWGGIEKGYWNGLIADIIKAKADLSMTSLKITSQRQDVVDFSVPFLETGIAIVVAKRTGVVSPTAFLEPFDYMSWLLILIISIQGVTISIFLFEWSSPAGYNMQKSPPIDHKFSLFRCYWLVWAILFGASVNMDVPRGYTARFMSNVWAACALVFLAVYTANLAAFMITREDHHKLIGLEDVKLTNPYSVKPPFRYGTIPYGSTEATIYKNYPRMYEYMRPHNRTNVTTGIRSVKSLELDAFIYDATVLEYLVGQDDDCRLLTVGKWYAMTGYGIAFPRKSRWRDKFNKWLLNYQLNGDLERLQKFWLTGACKMKKDKKDSSQPLGIKNFMSAFFLLAGGIVLGALLLGLEHFYFEYFRQRLSKIDKYGCCSLVSLSMGKSLSFSTAVLEAQDIYKHYRCKNPICDTQMWKVRRELDFANLKITDLEARLNIKKQLQILPISASSRKEYLAEKDRKECLAEKDLAKRREIKEMQYNINNADVTEIETVL